MPRVYSSVYDWLSDIYTQHGVRPNEDELNWAKDGWTNATNCARVQQKIYETEIGKLKEIISHYETKFEDIRLDRFYAEIDHKETEDDM